MVEIHRLQPDGLIELRPQRFFDDRGFFSEVWRDQWLAEAGLQVRFVQDNHSWSGRRGVLRGMHFQRPPSAQDKLVRVTRGAVFDVALDVRRDSRTYGRWKGIRLSSEEWNQLFIPKGFAHGFVALEDDTEVVYKVSQTYDPALELSIRFNDPDVGIEWPIPTDELTVSEKDRAAPLMREISGVL